MRVTALRVAAKVRGAVWQLLGPRTIGVRAVVMDEEDRVLLVRHTYGQPNWHLPGGGVKRREPLIAALHRELHEEVDLTVTGPVSLLGVYSNLSEGKSDHVAVFVVAQWSRATEVSRDPEIAESRFFALGGLPERTSPGTRRRLAEWRGERPLDFGW